MKKHLLISAASVALLSGASGAVFAQTSSDSTSPDTVNGIETVTVTGSHISQPGFTSPTPVMAISADTMEKVSPIVEDALAELPSIKASGPQQGGAGVGSGFGGFSTVNLRALGANRTLVLLDGDRFVGANSTGEPDVNLFPSGLIQRIDIVTGGASAAYGSDAVSGVANFIINKNYNGVGGSAESGISTYGDAAEYKVTLTGGTDFAGGKGHIEGNIETYNGQGIRNLSRDYTFSGANIIANTGAPAGSPKNLIVTDAISTTATLGGLVVSGPLKGTAFNATGQPYQFQYGTVVGSTWMLGGGGINGLTGYPASLAGGGIYGLTGNLGLNTPLQRNNFYGRVSYDIDPDVVVHADFLAGTSHSNFSPGYNYATSAPLAPIIKIDNAYLPAATAAAMTAAHVTSITLGESLDETVYRADGMDTTYRGSIGVDFKLGGGWTANGSYEHGKTLYAVHFNGMVITPNFVNAVDAVNVTAANVGASGLAIGSIVCRSTLTAPTNGCVPYDTIGVDQASQAAVKYVTGDEFDSTTTQQDAFSANATGPLFNLWAGPVSAAVGLDYRREAYSQLSDALSQTYNAATAANGLWRSGNTQPSAGSNQVTEGYLEFLIPLAKDMRFAEDFNLDLAARETDYKLSGSATTWKVGVNYQPIDDLRLRLTRSHDIRAPSLGELFLNGGENASTAGLTIPTAGGGTATTTTGTRQQTIGNVNLKPEKADTLTYGAVYSPSWLSSFTVSADAYAINIADAIGTLSATNEAQLCNQGNAQNCSFFTYTGSTVTVVNIEPFNFSSAKADGVDFDQQYSLNLIDINDALDGTLSTHNLASYVSHLSTTVPIAGTVDRAGDLGPNNGVAHWRGTFQLDYKKGPYDAFVQLRYMGAGRYNNTYVQGVDINNNYIPSITYVDFNFRYLIPDVPGDWAVFAGVNNALDQRAPLDPSTGSNGTYTQTSFYDVIGRYFRIGVDFKY